MGGFGILSCVIEELADFLGIFRIFGYWGGDFGGFLGFGWVWVLGHQICSWVWFSCLTDFVWEFDFWDSLVFGLGGVYLFLRCFCADFSLRTFVVFFGVSCDFRVWVCGNLGLGIVFSGFPL